MRVLVVNAGSSSIKVRLLDGPGRGGEQVLAQPLGEHLLRNAAGVVVAG